MGTWVIDSTDPQVFEAVNCATNKTVGRCVRLTKPNLLSVRPEQWPGLYDQSSIWMEVKASGVALSKQQLPCPVYFSSSTQILGMFVFNPHVLYIHCTMSACVYRPVSLDRTLPAVT